MREEIKTLARDLNYNVRFGGGDINGDAIQIENVLVALVRATLEEAARAVCHLCRDHYSVGRDSVGLWVHDPFMGATGAEVVYSACIATEIHDLIAAQEEGASHE